MHRDLSREGLLEARENNGLSLSAKIQKIFAARLGSGNTPRLSCLHSRPCLDRCRCFADGSEYDQTCVVKDRENPTGQTVLLVESKRTVTVVPVVWTTLNLMTPNVYSKMANCLDRRPGGADGCAYSNKCICLPYMSDLQDLIEPWWCRRLCIL